MAAIITDQLRIVNANNFVAGVQSSQNSYYAFIGMPNPADYSSTWDSDPPAPKDSFSQADDYYDTMLACKRINSADISQVVRKVKWTSGITYDMWRNDITRDNPSQPSGAFDIYSANYYIMNSDYRVYACLFNNANPENNNQGGPSLDEPTFTDLEPRAAGSSGDGYIWKYLFSVRPSQAIKFDSTGYLPVPDDWFTSASYSPIRENASSSGQIKIATITNRGVGLGTANITYTGVPILGDGNGAKATVVINNDSKVETVTIADGGSGYTYGSVDLEAGGVPTGTTRPAFNVIIPPPGGHGKDIYLELGALNAMAYARFENDNENPDFITGNQFARIGVIKNPQSHGSDQMMILDKASACYALRLTGTGYSSAVFEADSFITQTVGVGSTAVGRVISYDPITGVLKYWQDRTTAGFNSNGTANNSPIYGFRQNAFSHLVDTPGVTGGGSFTITGGSVSLGINTDFQGISTVINNRTYYLGQSFSSGVAQPEMKKYSGEVLYVDNRPSITRSKAQKEDVKIILQF
mgnify:FL=1